MGFLTGRQLSSPFSKGGPRGCPTTLQMPYIVILSEAKNLIVLGSYAFEILRLTPKNDVVGQPSEGDFAPPSSSRRLPRHTHCTSKAKQFHPDIEIGFESTEPRGKYF
jgi:hypothetical protein